MEQSFQSASSPRVDGVGNVMRVYGLADPIDFQEGMVAYERYHKTMRRIASNWGYHPHQVTGAFCALSPNNDWIGNLRSLISVLTAHRAGVSPDWVTVSTYNACKSRAWKCLGEDHFLDFTRGPKTRNFYTNIDSPEENHSVTIDGHMYGVWSGKRTTMKAVAEQRFNYEEVAFDFRTAAFHLGVRPNQVQAVCWFAWKRIHKVLFQPQLGLFAAGDQWGLLQDPERIRPFPFKRFLGK